MEEETNVQDQSIEFYIQHNTDRTTFELVVASDMPMESVDVIEALELLAAQLKHQNTDVFGMGDEFVIDYY